MEIDTDKRASDCALYWSSKLVLFDEKTAQIISIIVQICHDWVFYIMAADLPKYMKEVLGFSVHDIGLYSSLPYLLMWAVSVWSGFLSDYLIDHKYFSITQARKFFTALGENGQYT